MPFPADITIVGGGIMGLLSAREFILAGARVTIIDQNQTGREASWAGGGILLPLYPWRQDPAISQLVIPSLKVYPQLTRELVEATGMDTEWMPCGLFISQNPDIESAIQWCKQHRIQYQLSAPSNAGSISAKLDNPIWLPDIAQIRNPRLLKSLKRYLLDLGAKFIENNRLLALKTVKHRVDAIETTLGNIPVTELILTTGAWTGATWSKLFPDQESTVNIQPIRGQMLIYDAQPGLLEQIVLDGDRYLIPRRDGRIVVGSTVEHCGFEKQTTDQAREQLQQFAEQLLPALKNHPISHHWSGLRPGTAHGIPYIDKHPELDNLSVCAGHYRNGLTMGPASAKLLVDLICRRPNPIAQEPYQLKANH